jgi:GNAT superfamily N-acetyltransferase
MMNLTFRPISAFDEGYLELLLYETIFVLNDEAMPDRHILKRPEYQQYIRPWKDTDVGYIAIDPISGEAIGAVWLRFFTADKPGNAYINDSMPELVVVVDGLYRGDGVGTDLVHYLLAQLPTTVKGITLGVDIRNPALEFFERLGFAPFRIDKTIAILRYDRH